MESGRLTIFQAVAIEDRRLGHAAFRVLAALGRHSDRCGWCWPKQEDLARALGISRQAVGRSIGQLETLGYIEVHPQRDAFTKFRTGTRYRLLLDMDTPAAQRDVAQAPTQPGATQQDEPSQATKTPDLGNVRSCALTSQLTSQLTTQGDEENISPAPASPPVREMHPAPKPGAVEREAREISPTWRALVRVAGEPPAPGTEEEKWVKAHAAIVAACERAGIADELACAHEIHVRSRRYGQALTVRFTVPGLAGNWAALAHDPPPRPGDAPARASPGDTEALIAAQPRRTRHNIEVLQRFVERGRDGPEAFCDVLPPADGGDEQGAERPPRGRLVSEVRRVP